jgi:hypothetical protein
MNEPIGSKYFLTHQRRAFICIQPDGFQSRSSGIPQLLLQPCIRGDLEAVLEVWPSERVGVKTGLMMNELGLFKAVESTLPTTMT